MRAWAVTRICSAERRHASLCDTSERHGGDVLILICLPVSRDCRDRSPWRSGEPIHFFPWVVWKPVRRFDHQRRMVLHS